MFDTKYYNYISKVKNLLIKHNKAIVFVGIFIFWAWLFFSTQIVFSGFHFIDDHEVTNIYFDLYQQKMPLLEVIAKWLNVDHNVHRFRPFYYIHRVIETKFFGLNWFLWFFYRYFLLSLTTYILFIFGTLINFSAMESLLLALLTVLGEQTITWWRLGPAESIGMFLVSIALVFTVLSIRQNNKKHNIIFIFSTILASLTKESFIIFIPFLIAIKVWIPCIKTNIDIKKSIKNEIKIISTILFVLLSEVLYIKSSISLNGLGYAGVDKETLNVSKIFSVISSILNNSSLSSVFIIFACFILFSFFRKKIRLSKHICQRGLIIIVLFLLSIIPQILLYTKSGMSAYYLLPSLITTSLLTVIFIHFIGKYSQITNLLIISFVFVITFNKLPSVSTSMNNFALDGIATNNLLNKIEFCVKAKEKNNILLVVNPRLSYEISASIKKYFNYVKNTDNLILATYGIKGTDFYSETHKDAEQFWNFIDPKAIQDFYNNKTITNLEDKNTIMGIVIFSLKDDFINTSQDWFLEGSFKEFNYSLNYTGQNVTFYCKN